MSIQHPAGLPRLSSRASSAAVAAAVTSAAAGVFAPPQAAPLPPHGTTGGKLTPPPAALRLSVDWLNATFPARFLPTVRDLLAAHLGPAADRDRGVNFYASSAAYETGALLAWSDSRPESWVSINGDSLACIPSPWLLMAALLELGAKFTRVDLAADDFSRVLPLHEVAAASQVGNMVGYRQCRVDQQTTAGQTTGFVVWLGKRGSNGSGRFLRFYDKGMQSGGEVDAVRFEAELSGAVAQIVGESLAECDSEEKFRLRLASKLGGCVDFVERREGAHGHVDRMQRLPWWVAFLSRLTSDPTTDKPSRPVPPLQRAFQHLAKTYARTIGLVKQILDSQGDSFDEVLQRLLQLGEVKANGSRLGARFLGLNPATLIPPAGGA